MEIICETVGLFAENSYFIVDPESSEAIAVDPGDEPARLVAQVEARGWNVRYIINTHAHIDHVGAVAAMKRATGAPFLLHPAERELLAALPLQAAMFGVSAPEVPEVDGDLAEGDEFSVGDGRVNVKIIETPGHSAGGVTLELPGQLIVGDTLFAGSIGRTDLPGGDLSTLLASIRERLYAYPDETVIHPGHGPASTIGEERRSNPFARG